MSEEAELTFDKEIAKLEEFKVKNKKVVNQVSTVCYPLAGILAVCMFIFSWGGFVFILLGMIIGLPFLIKSNLNKELVVKFKNDIVKTALEKLRPDLVYSPDLHITQEVFESSNLFSAPDRYSGEDLIEGAHDKTTFSFSEIHAERRHKSKNNTHYSTICKGLFMVADFNKHIRNETYVLTSGAKIFSKFKRVKLENPVFEENFKVFSDNGIEARYILTPGLMEKIIDLEKKFNAQLYMSFRGCSVYIAMKTKENYFEPKIEGTITKEILNTILKEVDACISIIDELDLNTRIWTKE